MPKFKNPLNNPSEIDILGIIAILAGVFMGVAGFEGVYDLHRIGICQGEERLLLLRLGFFGLLLVLTGTMLFYRGRPKHTSDVLDEDQLSD